MKRPGLSSLGKVNTWESRRSGGLRKKFIQVNIFERKRRKRKSFRFIFTVVILFRLVRFIRLEKISTLTFQSKLIVTSFFILYFLIFPDKLLFSFFLALETLKTFLKVLKASQVLFPAAPILSKTI